MAVSTTVKSPSIPLTVIQRSRLFAGSESAVIVFCPYDRPPQLFTVRDSPGIRPESPPARLARYTRERARVTREPGYEGQRHAGSTRNSERASEHGRPRRLRVAGVVIRETLRLSLDQRYASGSIRRYLSG